METWLYDDDSLSSTSLLPNQELNLYMGFWFFPASGLINIGITSAGVINCSIQIENQITRKSMVALVLDGEISASIASRFSLDQVNRIGNFILTIKNNGSTSFEISWASTWFHIERNLYEIFIPIWTTVTLTGVILIFAGFGLYALSQGGDLWKKKPLIREYRMDLRENSLNRELNEEDTSFSEDQ